VQPGVVGIRGAITAAWEEDLRAVRQDRYDTDPGKEALAFIQRCYALVSDLRGPIQKAWGQGGHVHRPLDPHQGADVLGDAAA
jgi:hypothetical protein